MNRKWIKIIVVCIGAGYWTASVLWTIQNQQHPTIMCEHEHDPPMISMQAFVTPSEFSRHTLSAPGKVTTDDAAAEDERSSNDKSQPVAISTTTSVSLHTNATNSTIIDPDWQLHDNIGKKSNKTSNPYWWKRYVSKLARIWHSRSVESWCASVEPNPPTPILLGHGELAEGMIYIKTYKASSSTCEGIAWSIAHHVGQRRQQRQNLHDSGPNKNNKNNHSTFHAVCKAYTRHEFANNRMHARRHPTKSLMWSFVRDPAARDLSQIYHFAIGRKNETELTPTHMKKRMQTLIKGHQTRYLVPKKTSRAPLWPLHELRTNRTDLVLYMKSQIFENYDFLGITERMSESLAVMVLLWDLEPRDVIVLHSKRSGSFDDGGYNRTCTLIPKAVMTPELQEYFETNHPMWNADILLYHAAQASLQMTIDFLGRDMVAKMVETIEKLQTLAEETCRKEAFFPCSANGTFQPELAKQSCYVQDSGCGHACVDRVLSSIGLDT